MENINLEALPPHIAQHAEKAYERVTAFDPEGDSFRVFFITDIHIGGNENARQYGFLHTIAPAFHPDLLVNGGDLGLDLGEDEATSEAVLSANENGMNLFDEPFVLLKGNHDYGTQKVPNDVLNHRFNDRFVKLAGSHVNWVFEPHGGQYGVYHDPKTNVYLFLLNTSEGDKGNYQVSWEQIRYLGNQLMKLPANARVLWMSHRDIDASGFWSPADKKWDEPRFHFDTLKRLVEAFANRKSFQEEDLSFDFTKLSSSIRFYGWLCGDSHFFNDQTTNGVRYMVREGYGGVELQNVAKGGHKTEYNFQMPHPDKELECDFDLLVFRNDGKAKLFHFGPDEEKGDLLF